MKRLQLSLLAGVVFAGVFGGIVGTTMVPAGQAAACGSTGVLGIPPWYKGMTETGSDGKCKVKGPADTETGLQNYIWTIALNVVEIILRIVAYAAVLFIIYGGFLFITSNGSSETTARAVKTIINASIGMAIALSAVAIKNFVWEYLVSPGTNELGLPEKSPGEVLAAGLQAAYFIAGALAVIMLVIGGLNYTMSNGDSAKITKAKNTILYAVIGILVVIFAFAITTFINTRL